MCRSGVVLIGPRGAGKSSVARRLAPLLGLPRLDIDELVESGAGRSIAELMREGFFRPREEAVLRSVLAGPAAVVAAGGGAVLWDGFLSSAAAWRVVWLDADTDILSGRIRNDLSKRPSLTGRPADDEVAEVARSRRELYRAAAWRRVDTSGLDPDTVAAQIAKLLRVEHNADRPNAD